MLEFKKKEERKVSKCLMCWQRNRKQAREVLWKNKIKSINKCVLDQDQQGKKEHVYTVSKETRKTNAKIEEHHKIRNVKFTH